MVDLPESVLIGPYRYSVERDHDLNKTSDLCGCILYPQQTIKIATGQHPMRQRSTLLHEVLHGVLNVAGVEQGEAEESLINSLEVTLLDTLRRNPQLVAFLVSDD